jgi:hypothetical protein
MSRITPLFLLEIFLGNGLKPSVRSPLLQPQHQEYIVTNDLKAD